MIQSRCAAMREKAGYTNLAEGARISFEVTMKRGGKMSAENLRLG